MKEGDSKEKMEVGERRWIPGGYRENGASDVYLMQVLSRQRDNSIEKHVRHGLHAYA